MSVCQLSMSSLPPLWPSFAGFTPDVAVPMGREGSHWPGVHPAGSFSKAHFDWKHHMRYIRWHQKLLKFGEKQNLKWTWLGNGGKNKVQILLQCHCRPALATSMSIGFESQRLVTAHPTDMGLSFRLVRAQLLAASQNQTTMLCRGPRELNTVIDAAL